MLKLLQLVNSYFLGTDGVLSDQAKIILWQYILIHIHKLGVEKHQPNPPKNVWHGVPTQSTITVGESEKWPLQTEHADRGHTLAWQLTHQCSQPYFVKALHLWAEARKVR